MPTSSFSIKGGEHSGDKEMSTLNEADGGHLEPQATTLISYLCCCCFDLMCNSVVRIEEDGRTTDHCAPPMPGGSQLNASWGACPWVVLSTTAGTSSGPPHSCVKKQEHGREQPLGCSSKDTVHAGEGLVSLHVTVKLCCVHGYIDSHGPITYRMVCLVATAHSLRSTSKP